MIIIIFVFLCRILWTTGAEEMEICSCPESDGQIRCSVTTGVSLNRGGSCHGDSLRVSGDGFVVEAETFKDLKRVMLEKTTLTCEDGWNHFPNAREQVFNGVGCTRTTSSTKVCLLHFSYLMQYSLSERQSQTMHFCTAYH